MSGLAGLLARRRPAGLYLWHSALDVADVRHAVEHAGWGFVTLDGVGIETKAELLAAAGVALDLPDYYGQNFDALADLLADVDDPVGVVLLWDQWGPFARADPQAFRVALSVLGTRVHAERGAPFAVLLRGDGPAVEGLTSLD
jgi:Barstar (barnase inhibitor)